MEAWPSQAQIIVRSTLEMVAIPLCLQRTGVAINMRAQRATPKVGERAALALEMLQAQLRRRDCMGTRLAHDSVNVKVRLFQKKTSVERAKIAPGYV